MESDKFWAIPGPRGFVNARPNGQSSFRGTPTPRRCFQHQGQALERGHLYRAFIAEGALAISGLSVPGVFSKVRGMQRELVRHFETQLTADAEGQSHWPPGSD